MKTLGELGVIFGLTSAYWWVAHQLCWWTFGLITTGGILLAALLGIVAANSTSNQESE